MKNLIQKIVQKPLWQNILIGIGVLFFLLIVFFLLSNCGSVDSLDIDKFNVFNEQEKNFKDNFRRQTEYNQSPLVEFLLDNNDPESLKFNENIDLFENK